MLATSLTLIYYHIGCYICGKSITSWEISRFPKTPRSLLGKNGGTDRVVSVRICCICLFDQVFAHNFHTNVIPGALLVNADCFCFQADPHPCCNFVMIFCRISCVLLPWHTHYPTPRLAVQITISIIYHILRVSYRFFTTYSTNSNTSNFLLLWRLEFSSIYIMRISIGYCWYIIIILLVLFTTFSPSIPVPVPIQTHQFGIVGHGSLLAFLLSGQRNGTPMPQRT